MSEGAAARSPLACEMTRLTYVHDDHYITVHGRGAPSHVLTAQPLQLHIGMHELLCAWLCFTRQYDVFASPLTVP